ncbi:MAG: OB-fold protein [Bacteroidia bacterium]
MRKKLLLIALLLGLIVGAYGLYEWFRPLAGIESLRTEYSLPASDLFDTFDTDEQAANALYLDKVIEVTGLVRELHHNGESITALVLETNDPIFGINCAFEQTVPLKKITQGDLITIKGVCTGFISDVVLNRCTFIE